MSRILILIAAFSLAFATVSAPANANDFVAACQAFGSAELVFVGRPQAQVKRRISGEAEIEKARLKLVQAEADLARVQSLDLHTRAKFEHDLTLKQIKARAEFDAVKAHYPPPIDLTLTSVTVEVAFRGITTPEALVWIKHSETPLDSEKSYLFYAQRPIPFAPEVIDPLGLPKDLEAAQEDLRFLELAASGAHGATVYGALTLENPAELGQPGSPMADVTIRLSSDGYVAEATTKNDGSFLVTGVPAGSLEIKPLLPEHLTILPHSSWTHQIQGGGCIPAHLRAALNGRVRGKVLTDRGMPLSFARVDLISVDPRRAQWPRGQFDVRTNQEGEFEFAGLPPGAYRLGINVVWPANSGAPYPPTYFPNTTDRDAAEPITVGEGTLQDGLQFLLSNPLRRGQFEILVDTGGRLQNDVYVCGMGLGESGKSGGAGGYEKRPGVPILIDVVEGVRYRINAHAETPEGHFDSEPVEVKGAAGRTSIKLNATVPSKDHAHSRDCGGLFRRR